MFDFLGISLLLSLALIFAWLARRAWRLKRPVVKSLTSIVAGLLSLVAFVLLGAALFGYWKLNRNYDNPEPQLKIARTEERVARGKRFEPLCGGCHAPAPGASLTGQDFLGDDAPPIGNFHAPNLTPVHLADWSDGDIVRAIREGIHPSGRSLLIMPSRVLRNLSDEDVQAIVAYLRYLPPEGEETPPNRLNTLGAIMVLKASIFEAQPPVTEPVLSPPAGPTAAYGAYLSSFTCEICHGADLLGDPKFQGPPLVAIPIAWSDEDFIDFMRTGIRPDGSSVDEEAMPWKDLSRMFSDDEELLAIYAFLQKKGGEFANR